MKKLGLTWKGVVIKMWVSGSSLSTSKCKDKKALSQHIPLLIVFMKTVPRQKSSENGESYLIHLRVLCCRWQLPYGHLFQEIHVIPMHSQHIPESQGFQHTFLLCKGTSAPSSSRLGLVAAHIKSFDKHWKICLHFNITGRDFCYQKGLIAKVHIGDNCRCMSHKERHRYKGI